MSLNASVPRIYAQALDIDPADQNTYNYSPTPPRSTTTWSGATP
jgi:hypothetical protein